MPLPTILKSAALLPEVELQPHQKKIEEEARKGPIRKLLLHGLGSGKTLSSIAAEEAHSVPFTAIVPASLRPNYQQEVEKWTDRKLPSEVMSYSQLSSGRHPVHYPESLVFDEVHKLRNPNARQTQAAMDLTRKAKQIILNTGTPLVNEPSDLAVPLSMLINKDISPNQFNQRFLGERKVYPNLFRRLMGVQPGIVPDIKHPDELKALLKGHVDYYMPDKPVVPVQYEDHPVDMSVPQSQLYNAMWGKLPFYIRWKLKHDFPLNADELKRMTSFLTGPRQVGLSTYPYMRKKDPLKAFQQSPKLQKAMELLQQKLQDQRTKALIFSNFIDAGLTPYAAGLQQAGVPHGVFHGGLSDHERKKLVDDYNNNRIRVALLGPSGTEGLSFKGTQLVQQLDSSWNPIRPKQSVGRALRYDSHFDLPQDLQNVTVQRFIARLPLGVKDRILSRLGFNRQPEQVASDDYLRQIEARKGRLNKVFLDLLKDVGSHS